MISSHPAYAAPSVLKYFVAQPYLVLAYDLISLTCRVSVYIGRGSLYTAELFSIQLRTDKNNCIFQRSTYSSVLSRTVALPPIIYNVIKDWLILALEDQDPPLSVTDIPAEAENRVLLPPSAVSP